MTRKLTYAVIGLGVLLRLRQFLFMRTMWCDEVMLAFNIAGNSVGDLLTKPLAFNQVAPIGYLLLSKIPVALLGSQEISFRLIPFLFGATTPLLAYLIGSRVFKSDWSTLLFTLLTAVSPLLVFYSNEVKPYSSDVFFALSCVLAYLRYRDDKPLHWPLLATGIVAVFCSFPSCFILAAIGVVEFARALLVKERGAAIRIVLFASGWLAAFMVMFFVFMQRKQGNDYLTGFWQSGFMPTSPAEIVPWLMQSLASLPEMAFQQYRAGAPITPELWLGPPSLMLAILVTPLAAISLRKPNAALLIFLIALTLNILVSAFKLYPFEGRTILYLTPLVFLVIAGGIDVCLQSRAVWQRWAAVVLAGLCLVTPLVISAQVLARPTQFSDMKALLAYLEQHREPDQRLAVSQWSEQAYIYYAPLYDMPRPDHIIHFTFDVDRFISQNEGAGPTWLIFSHRIPDSVLFVKMLNQRYPVIEDCWADEAVCFLVDLSAPNRPPEATEAAN